MVYVTVLLLRCGETQVDAFGDYEPPPETTDDDNVSLSPSASNPSLSPSPTSPGVVESSSLLHKQQQQHEEDEDVINVSDEDDDEEEDGEIGKADDNKYQASRDSYDKEEEKDTCDTQEPGQDRSDHFSQQPSSPAPPLVNEEATQPVTKPGDDYDERPRRLRLSEYIDPFMTQKGYHTAQEAFTSLMAAISQSTTEERRMACFSAPTKACTGTAYMIGCSNLNQYNNLRWQLSTKKCLQAPCAIPIVVHNSLCTKDPKIDRCGGDQPVIDAGLLHCSASPWNDARQKCPFSLIVKKFKYKIKAWVREWKDEEQLPSKEVNNDPVEKETLNDVSEEDDSEKVDDDEQPREASEASLDEKHLKKEDVDDEEEQETPDETQSVNEEGYPEKVNEGQQQEEDIEKTLDEDQPKKEGNQEEEEEMRPRRVLDIQYFRLDDLADPWSLKPMVLKNNALIDLIDPFRYMTPPRKGNLGLKRENSTERPGPAEAVQQAVWWARQVGCDVVIMVVGEAAMQELAKAGGLLGDDDQLEAPPCSIATLIADVPDLEQSDNGDDDEDDDGEADGNEDIGATGDEDEIQESGGVVEIDENAINDGNPKREVVERGTAKSNEKGNDKDGEQENDGQADEKPFADYDFTQIRLGFHGFFTVEDLIKDPSQVLPAYTGPVDVLIPPSADNNPMDIPVNQWSVFSPPKPENITTDYPDLPPFSQALQLPLPKRSHYKPPKIQYEKQISPLVPPNMPNPYMSPQRPGDTFTSPHGSPAPQRDWEVDNDLNRSAYEVRVPYGQRQSYNGQPFSPVQSQQSYRGSSYAPPQHDFGQPHVSPRQPYQGSFYPPEPHHFERPPYPPVQREQPYRGTPYHSEQQPDPQYFQGQNDPSQRQFYPNSQRQHHSPVHQPFGRQLQSPHPYNNQLQGHSYPPQQHSNDGQSYPPQQYNYLGQHDGPPNPHYPNANRDLYASSNNPFGATSPGVAPPDWDDA
jgi:hypothetical protein